MKTRRKQSHAIGAHMSVEGGPDRAVDRAEQIGATALQIFVKSARQWISRPLAEDAIERYRRRSAESGLRSVTLAHASYLINLAAPPGEVRQRSLRALGDEVDRCQALGIPFLVLHPGAHVGAGEESGLRRVVDGLDRVFRQRAPRTDGVTVLLEITAGQGTNLGHRFEHLAWILERAGCEKRLGICFDTCHALAAGHEFRDRRSYRATLEQFDRLIGLDRLRAFHFNDSKFPLGSRKDRHEHVGLGEVGLEAFRLILGDRRFRGLPMILETPKGPDGAEDRVNLEVLRSMLPGRRR